MCGVFVFLTETPLSLAVQCEPSGGEAIRVLVEGGAHIDFRSKDGLTPVHKAVRGHRHTALLVNVHASSRVLKNADVEKETCKCLSAPCVLALKVLQSC